MEYTDMRFEVKDRIAYITLDRPDVLNAFNRNLKQELEDAVSRIEKDPEIWGVIITGSGRAFSSGTDITDFPSGVEEARRITAYSQKLFNRIEDLEKPVIAAVNGYALGGGFELALVCDIRVASEKAKFGFPEVKVCAIPCYGGTQRLTRLVGAGKSKELIYTGSLVSAEEAYALRLVNKVVPKGQEVPEAEAMMKNILANAPMAVAYAKRCINAGAEMPLTYALDLEQDLVSMLVATKDMAEGTKAFLEKRQPVFQNQ